MGLVYIKPFLKDIVLQNPLMTFQYLWYYKRNLITLKTFLEDSGYKQFNYKFIHALDPPAATRPTKLKINLATQSFSLKKMGTILG